MVTATLLLGAAIAQGACSQVFVIPYVFVFVFVFPYLFVFLYVFPYVFVLVFVFPYVFVFVFLYLLDCFDY